MAMNSSTALPTASTPALLRCCRVLLRLVKQIFHVIWELQIIFRRKQYIPAIDQINNTSNKAEKFSANIRTLQSTISSAIFGREDSCSMDIGDWESSSSRILSNSDFRVFRTDFGYPFLHSDRNNNQSCTKEHRNNENAGKSKQNSPPFASLYYTYRASEQQPYSEPFPPVSLII